MEFKTIYGRIGYELEAIASQNGGKLPKVVFEQTIANNFGCHSRTIISYTRIFKTFGVIRAVNQNWYTFTPYNRPLNGDNGGVEA